MRVLVTGGAGFIGSHLVDALVGRGDEVVVVDDLETGFRENVHTAARLEIGSIVDEDFVRGVMQGCELVFHQAAHKAVMRSVERPLITDTVNTHGTLTVLKAALDAGVRRVVHASSSSIYGGTATLPTTEDEPANPRSPYAVSKLAAEHYCRVFTELYGLETVALRYFNVYGPRQRPDATYAAVIPLFVDALLKGGQPVVHGDGLQSRDFTYITDVVDANLAAARGRRIAAPAARTTLPAACRRRCSTSCGSSASSSMSFRARSSSNPVRATCATAGPTRARPPSTSTSAPGSRSTTASARPSIGFAASGNPERQGPLVGVVTVLDVPDDPFPTLRSGVRFLSNGRISVLLFGEFTSCFSAWM